MYEVIQRIKVENGDRVRYDRRGTEMVIERFTPDPAPPGEEDVTAECRVQLRRSKTSGGYYVGICHGYKMLVGLGVDEKSKVIPFQSNQYHIEPAPGATVSFRVTRRV